MPKTTKPKTKAVTGVVEVIAKSPGKAPSKVKKEGKTTEDEQFVETAKQLTTVLGVFVETLEGAYPTDPHPPVSGEGLSIWQTLMQVKPILNQCKEHGLDK